jgi:hypothetical protein
MTTDRVRSISLAGVAIALCCCGREPPPTVPARSAARLATTAAETAATPTSPELQRLPDLWAPRGALSPALREAWRLTSELTAMAAPTPPPQTEIEIHRTWVRDAYVPWHRQRLQLFDRIMTAIGGVQRAGAIRETIVAAVLAAISHESVAGDWSRIVPIGCEMRGDECQSTNERLEGAAGGWYAGAVERYGYCAYHASKDARMSAWEEHCHARLDELERTTGQRL